MSNNILNKINALMQDLDAVGKNSVNKMQGFNFRGIDTMLNTFKPLFTKHGIVMTVNTLSFNQELKEVVRGSGKNGIDKHVSMLLKYTFHSADDGSSVSSTVPAEGLDSGDKATTKALSMGLKYALIQTFVVPTEDIADGDSDSPEITKATKTTNVVVSTPVVPKPAEAKTAEVKPAERPKFQRPSANLNSWSK